MCQVGRRMHRLPTKCPASCACSRAPLSRLAAHILRNALVLRNLVGELLALVFEVLDLFPEVRVKRAKLRAQRIAHSLGLRQLAL